jgi:hypothetical protein
VVRLTIRIPRENSMRRPTTSCLLAFALVASMSSLATAQVGFSGNRFSTQPSVNPFSRPLVSPYVNLLNNNNSTVLNYYGLVRPEVDALDAQTRLQSSFESLDDRVRRQTANSQLGASGHAARFMTDLRGSPANLPIEMQGRRQRQEEKAARTGYAAPRTGHSSYFGNNATFYQKTVTRQ